MRREEVASGGEGPLPVVSGGGDYRDSRWPDRARFPDVFGYWPACGVETGWRGCGGEAMSLAPGMDSAIEHGSAEYLKLLHDTNYGLPASYGPDVEMALANDANELGTAWIPVHEKFSGTLDGKPFAATRVLIRIDGVVHFWHRVSFTHGGAGITVIINMAGPLWTKHESNASHGYESSGQVLRQVIPGMRDTVPGPCRCWDRCRLETLIVHLNDAHEWTREQIADWLDTLDLDLAFPVPETIPSSIH